MAFLKYGSAGLTEPGITWRQWQQLGNASHIKIATHRLSSDFPEKEYLLSHATIIASVNVENADTSAGAFKDYLITPETAKYVNKNMDCWTEGVLSNSYTTFRNKPNYVEHVQVPALMKGRIIDAIPREVDGITLIDILVATSKKHTDLIRKIESGYFGGMSMGSIVKFTICSKCGKVIHDETEKCTHIRYELGDTYTDSKGVQRIVAELCGHLSSPDSNIFIEASWVKDPAFVGAVVSNILNPSAKQVKQLKEAFTRDVEILEAEPVLLKAASIRTAEEPEEEVADEPLADMEFEDMSMPEEEEEETAIADEGRDRMQERLVELSDDLLDRIIDKVEEQLGETLFEEDPDIFNEGVDFLNDSLVKSVTYHGASHRGNLRHIMSKRVLRKVTGY